MEVKPGYKQTNLGVLPQDWKICSVGAMGDVRAGKALAAKGMGLRRPYLRTKNVFDGQIDLADVLRMPMTDAEFSRYRLRHGDVLLNEGQSLELVGRCAMYKDEYPEPCAIQNQLVRFRARDGVSASFAAHLFRYCQKNGVFATIAMQTTSVAHLGVSRFHRLQLAWPRELIEQDRIAGALSDVDALIESLQLLIVKKQDLKQGAMQELLSGKNRLPGFKDEWEIKRLGDLAKIQRGASPRPIDSPIWFDEKSSVGWVRISDVTTSGIYLYETAQRLSALGIQNSRPVSRGSLIMSICATVGRPVITEIDVCIHDGFVVFDKMEINKHFLYYVLKSIEDRWSRHGQTGSQMNLNTGLINRTEVPVPLCGEEQATIAAILTDMDQEIATLEGKLSKVLQIKQGMMQELLSGRTRLI